MSYFQWIILLCTRREKFRKKSFIYRSNGLTLFCEFTAKWLKINAEKFRIVWSVSDGQAKYCSARSKDLRHPYAAKNVKNTYSTVDNTIIKYY